MLHLSLQTFPFCAHHCKHLHYTCVVSQIWSTRPSVMVSYWSMYEIHICGKGISKISLLPGRLGADALWPHTLNALWRLWPALPISLAVLQEVNHRCSRITSCRLHPVCLSWNRQVCPGRASWGSICTSINPSVFNPVYFCCIQIGIVFPLWPSLYAG